MALPESGYVQPVEIVVGGALPRSGYVQPVDIVGTGVSMAIGGLVVGGTPGSVLFVDAAGNLGQNNASFFWDNTKQKLVLTGSDPASTLDVFGSSSGSQSYNKIIRWYNNTGVLAGYINGGGGIVSSNFMVISGVSSGSGDTQQFTFPTADPFMLGLWSDVSGPAMQIRPLSSASPNRCIDFLDSAGTTYNMSVLPNGFLRWSGSDFASGDTSLGRDAAGVLAIKLLTTAQTLRIYGNETGSKYLSLSHNGTNGLIDASSGNLTFGGTATAVLFPVGAVGGPGISFSGDATSGFYETSAGTIRMSISGTQAYAWNSATLFLLNNAAVISMGASNDANIARDAAQVVAIKNANNAQTFRVYAGNGANCGIVTVNESLTIAAAASTDSATTIPAGAVIMSVAVRVTTVIPTAATFTVTAATGGNTFDTAAVSTAANSTDAGTAAGALYTSAGTKVRITPNINPASATGVVRLAITYYLSTPPTS